MTESNKGTERSASCTLPSTGQQSAFQATASGDATTKSCSAVGILIIHGGSPRTTPSGFSHYRLSVVAIGASQNNACRIPQA